MLKDSEVQTLARANSKPTRIDKELDDLLKDIAKKNDMSIRQASRVLARNSRVNLKGAKVTREIRF